VSGKKKDERWPWTKVYKYAKEGRWEELERESGLPEEEINEIKKQHPDWCGQMATEQPKPDIITTEEGQPERWDFEKVEQYMKEGRWEELDRVSGWTWPDGITEEEKEEMKRGWAKSDEENKKDIRAFKKSLRKEFYAGIGKEIHQAGKGGFRIVSAILGGVLIALIIGFLLGPTAGLVAGIVGGLLIGMKR
jgi:F0F1-type ATP synthase assembly protein I